MRQVTTSNSRSGKGRRSASPSAQVTLPMPRRSASSAAMRSISGVKSQRTTRRTHRLRAKAVCPVPVAMSRARSGDGPAAAAGGRGGRVSGARGAAQRRDGGAVPPDFLDDPFQVPPFGVERAVPVVAAGVFKLFLRLRLAVVHGQLLPVRGRFCFV